MMRRPERLAGLWAAAALLLYTTLPTPAGAAPQATMPAGVEGLDDLLPDAAAVCTRHTRGPRAGPLPRVFDFFMFNGELDMLEIRLNELDRIVDVFVLLESRVTHQNQPKPLYFQLNQHRFWQFQDKIVYLVVDELRGADHDSREAWNRDQLFTRGLAVPGREAAPGDILIMGDVDEIPKPGVILGLKACDFAAECVNLNTTIHYYSYSGAWEPWGDLKVAVFHKEHREKPLAGAALRKTTCTLSIPESSRHCSYCFPRIADVRRKLASFMHANYNAPPFTDPRYIVDRVARGLWLFDPSMAGTPLTRAPYHKSAPQYVLDNPARFHWLMVRDSLTGSFSDYNRYFPNGRTPIEY